MIHLQFDGLFSELDANSRKAGFLCYGWLIWHDSLVVARGHGGVARAHNANSNVAEYLALIEGLDALADLGDLNEPVMVWGDAKCVIDQMRGISGVNSPIIQPLYRKACKLADRFAIIDWTWKPRCHNREADRLTRLAMRQILSDPECYKATIQILESCSKQRLSTKFVHLLDLRVYSPPSPFQCWQSPPSVLALAMQSEATQLSTVPSL